MTSTPETPLVTVIMPAFNCGSLIAESLDSIRAQTFQDFEVIVVDDGSTDETAAIVRRYCEMDRRFSLVQQPNAGISAARNAAILRARTEWIALLDGDDIWFPEKLAVQMELARQDPRANLLFTNFVAWDGTNELTCGFTAEEPLPEGDVIVQLIFRFLFLPSSVVARRQTLLETGMFDVEMRMTEDWDMWLRIAERGIWVRGTREILVRYRRWPGSHTVKNRLKSLETNVLMMERRLRAAKRPDLLPLYQRSFTMLKNYYDIMCARYGGEEDPAALAALVWRAWRSERRLKWLRWYVLLIWPERFGGDFTRRSINRKIAKRISANKLDL